MESPPIAPDNPRRLFSAKTIINKISSSLLGAARRFGEVNSWLAKYLHTSAKFLAGVEIVAILTAGFTMIGVAEYAAAIFCWIVIALVVVAKIVDSDMAWRWKAGVVLASILVSVCLITWTNLKRGNEEWSAFSPEIRGLVIPQKALDKLPPPRFPPDYSGSTNGSMRVVHDPKPKSVPSPEDRSDMADVSATFSNPEQLSIVAINTSQFTAWDTKFDVELWDLDEARNLSLDTSLSLPTFVEISKGDFLKPTQSYTPRTVLDSAKSTGRLKEGDRLAGYGAVTCSNCQNIHWYWIYYIEGNGGWYWPIKVGLGPDKNGFRRVIPDMTKDAEFWFRSIPLSERLQIK